MYKYWHTHEIKAEYCFLTSTAKRRTYDDVRTWMKERYPNIDVKRIVED